MVTREYARLVPRHCSQQLRRKQQQQLGVSIKTSSYTSHKSPPFEACLPSTAEGYIRLKRLATCRQSEGTARHGADQPGLLNVRIQIDWIHQHTGAIRLD